MFQQMYHLNLICQSQQVSCEGTWCPYNSRNLEAYKLEASRQFKMTGIYNPDFGNVEEKKQKGVSKVKRNLLPLCFIQKLEKVVSKVKRNLLQLCFIQKLEKVVSKVKRNLLPLCFIQKLERVVYLNHAMSHLTSSTAGKYHLRELDAQSNPSFFLTQLYCEEESKWPCNNPLIDVTQ